MDGGSRRYVTLFVENECRGKRRVTTECYFDLYRMHIDPGQTRKVTVSDSHGATETGALSGNI